MLATDGDGVVYLDYNATAPVRPEAREAMIRALAFAGNASSTHRPGRDAAEAVEQARADLADLLHCSPSELVFTSGATEANNLAIRSAVADRGPVIVSSVEHPAVAEAAKATASAIGTTVLVVGVDPDGVLRLDDYAAALRRQPSLVSIMAANNETGVLNDLQAIVALARETGALVHTDATQLVGRLPIDVRDLGVDLLSLSAHKFGGPQGVGALYVRRGLPIAIQPLAYGGGHERGRRPGTLNVAGIVGLGAAARIAGQRMREEAVQVRALRDRFEAGVIAGVANVRCNGSINQRLPGVSSLTFADTPADALLAAMPEVAASEGSACTAGAPEPSPVLLAMGLSRRDAECTLRFSLGYATTSTEVDRAIRYVADGTARVRSALHAPATHSDSSGSEVDVHYGRTDA
jgi:cysteine desulfurase